jgi:uncharacterized protein
MSESLRDQLLKLGLTTAKEARQARQQVAREQRGRPKTARTSANRPATASGPANPAKVERDRALNRQREADAQAKARWAEVRQLIEGHRVPKADGHDYFNFVDRGKVRRIAVDADLRARILGGDLAIVRCEGRYDLVPEATAERIREREPRAVVSLAAGTDSPQDEDPYKDYVVPDDLQW